MSQQNKNLNDDSKTPSNHGKRPHSPMLESIPPNVLEYYIKTAEKANLRVEKLNDPGAFDIIPKERYCPLKESEMTSFMEAGLTAICHGEVAVITLAGGQASRLGADVPKGMYPLDLGFDKPSMNTLLYQQASQLKAMLNLANSSGYKSCSIGWIIMTSTSTDKQTRDFITEVCDDVGFPIEKVIFIVQPDLPICGVDGKFLCDNDKVMLAPNGNGGLFEALKPLLPSLRTTGYKYFHVYCVDNILCYVADPVFLGASILHNADCAAKVVEKTNPEEKIGVIGMQPLSEGLKNSKFDFYIGKKMPVYWNKEVSVIEYSEMSAERKAARCPISGRLIFRAGNIANHFFTIDFLDVACDADLPLHRAEKNVRHRERGSSEYSVTTGVKLERFIFDVFPLAANFFALEVDRVEEFSPLKNTDDIGIDCPATCKNALISRQKKWIEESGVDLKKLVSKQKNASSVSKEGIFLPTVSYFQNVVKDEAFDSFGMYI